MLKVYFLKIPKIPEIKFPLKVSEKVLEIYQDFFTPVMMLPVSKSGIFWVCLHILQIKWTDLMFSAASFYPEWLSSPAAICVVQVVSHSGYDSCLIIISLPRIEAAPFWPESFAISLHQAFCPSSFLTVHRVTLKSRFSWSVHPYWEQIINEAKTLRSARHCQMSNWPL